MSEKNREAYIQEAAAQFEALFDDFAQLLLADKVTLAVADHFRRQFEGDTQRVTFEFALCKNFGVVDVGAFRT